MHSVAVDHLSQLSRGVAPLRIFSLHEHANEARRRVVDEGHQCFAGLGGFLSGQTDLELERRGAGPLYLQLAESLGAVKGLNDLALHVGVDQIERLHRCIVLKGRLGLVQYQTPGFGYRRHALKQLLDDIGEEDGSQW